ncbi:MAG TPA: hypothetical protein DCZ10_07410 [Pelotomaculum sp.]|jgi:hypothetical protein|nr:hypothetical protein [Pelotomaculum sp.]
MQERRQISRVDYIVKGQAEYKGKFFPGEITNISLNGLLFRSDELMDASEQEKITIMINWEDEGENTVSAINCRVIRKNDHILGLKVDFIDYDTLMALKEKLADKIGEKINEEFIDFMIGDK